MYQIQTFGQIFIAQEMLKLNKNHIPIVKNNKVIFYKSKDGECYYSKSPCTNYFNGNDFTLKDINLKEKNKYKKFFILNNK